MAGGKEQRLSASEVAEVLRRSAQHSAHHHEAGGGESVSVSILVQVAAAAGIPEQDVHRAIRELESEHPAENDSVAKFLYGPSRFRVVQEIKLPEERAAERLEFLLRVHQGLKMRSKTGGSSLWDSGDELGAVRRTLDFSMRRTLLKARSVELRVGEFGEERSGAYLTADLSNQREEYLSLSGVLGATLSIPLAIAGVYEPMYFVGILPALVLPGLGFRVIYRRACAEMRRALDELLDVAEQGDKEGPRYREQSPNGEKEFEHVPRSSLRGEK
jgi:hypothetical protein